MSTIDILLARLDAELARRDIRSELKYDGVWKLFVFHSENANDPILMINSAFEVVRYSVFPSNTWEYEFQLKDIGELEILAEFIVNRVLDTNQKIKDRLDDGNA